MKGLILVVFIVLFIRVGKNQVYCQTQFENKIVVNDQQGRVDSLVFGYNSAGTYCIDSVLGEIEFPPTPPPEVFDIRFIDSRSRSGACLGRGIKKNFHSFPPSLDTFKIALQTSEDAYPITISWDIINSFTISSAKLKYFDEVNGPVTIDMLTTQSHTINSSFILLSIVIVGPIVECDEPALVISDVNADSITHESAKLEGVINYIGNNQFWFRWGATIEMENETPKTSLTQAMFTQTISGLLPSTLYYYRANVWDCFGIKSSAIHQFQTLGPTNVLDDGALPKTFSLKQNYPNPFNPTTLINYSIPGIETYGKTEKYFNTSLHVSLKIYNMLGQLVAALVDEIQEPGNKTKEWIADGLPGGIYYYRLTAGQYVDVKKMILAK